MAFILVGLLLVSVAALLLAGVLALRHHLSRPDALEQLGVKTTYPLKGLPKAKIDSYYELKDRLHEQYASRGSERSDCWMSSLPVQAKDALKYKLMQRAIGDMAALQKIDTDARGYWRLFCKGVITTQFWSSVMDAERELSQELESVKTEASNVEPTQDPQGILSEAMKFVVRYGDKLPSAAELASSADALADLMKHLPPMPGMPPGGLPPLPPGGLPGMPPGGLPGMPPGGLPGMPPGGMPPGAMPPDGLPPIPPLGGMRPPFGQQAAPSGGSGDTYTWKQDAEEIEVLVTVPSTATKTNVKVVFQTRSIKVEHCGETLVEGALAGTCRPENSTWTLSKGRVALSLDKAAPRPWPALFAEPKP